MTLASRPPHVATRPRTRRERRARFREDIEGMRALAVVLVVAFHAGVPFVGGGFVGVDVFFVLSGFLITGLLVDEMARTGTISIRGFYARRVRRLLPMATLVLVATAAAAYVLVPPIDRKGVAGDIVGSALWSANWRFAAESTQYMADTDKSPVLHYWSLAVEEQFYVVWPLLLLALVGTSGLALRAWHVAHRRISLALGVLIALSLWISWAQTESGSAFAYFGLHTRAWELGVGAALALLRPSLQLLTVRAAEGMAALGLLMVVGSALLMDEATPFPGTAALVPVLGTALLVAAGVRRPDGLVSSTLSCSPARYVGRISYSWYLWHWPVLVLATVTLGELREGADGMLSPHAPLWLVVLAVGLSFALAAASHHLVEQPMRTAPFLALSRRRSLLAGAVLVAASLTASAGLVLTAARSGDDLPVSPPPGPVAAEPRGAATPGPTGSAQTATPAALREPNSPREARASRPAVGEPCYLGPEPTAVPRAEECRVGPASGADRTIVLIGDSHAAAWYPALRRTAEERNWTLYFFGKAACAVADVEVLREKGTARYDACTTWRENLLDRLEEVGRADAVVIGRWMSYRASTVLPDGSVSSPRTVGPQWQAGSRRTFERLRALTRRIVIVKDVPWPGSDVPACLSEHDRVAQCAFSTADGSRKDASLVAAEAAAAPGLVRHIDMTDVICPDDLCHVVSRTGQIKYRDTHHLSAGFSATLWRPLSRRLEAAIG